MSHSLNPTGGESGIKTFRCSNAVWMVFKQHCDAEAETYSSVLRELIEGYLWTRLGTEGMRAAMGEALKELSRRDGSTEPR